MARSSRWKDASASAQGSVPPPGAPVPPAQPAAPAPAPGMQMPAPAPPYPAPQAAAPTAAPAQYPAPAAPFAQPVAPAQASATPVEGEVAELKSTLADLAATVAALVERTNAPAPVAAAGASGGTSDTDQVSRIIIMANRTAETTIEDARTEATGIVAAAKAQSFEIIRMARDLANQELAAERERVARSTEAWLAKRTEVTEQLRQLEATFAEYQNGLGGVGESIRSAVVQLESDASELPVIDELPAPDPSAFIGTELPEAAPAVDGDEAVAVEDAAADDAADDVIDLTDGQAAAAGEPEVVAAAAEAGSEGVTVAAPGRTSLFGGSPTLPTGPGGAPPAWPAPEAPAAADEPGSNLRPGLFGR